LLAGLFVVLVLAPLAVAAWLTDIEPAGLVNELATAFGLAAGAMLCSQFLTSGRYESLSGRLGIDRTMGFHRIAALALLAFAVAHPLVYVLDTAISDPAAAWQRFTGLLLASRTRTGVIALCGLFVIVAVAVWRDAIGIRYEIWRASHGLLAIAVVAVTIHHAITAGSYSAEPYARLLWWCLGILALAAAVVVYVVRPWRMWREPWRIESVATAGEGAWEIELRGPDSTAFSFRPGQFVWMTIEPNRPPFHDHPFSISSAPHELPRLRFLIRSSGDCTSTFGSIAPGTRVAIDGPHGSFVLSEAGSTVLMLAGGVGVAPILGMLEHAAARGDRRKFHMIIAGRTSQSIPGLSRLRALQSHLDLTLLPYVDTPSNEPGFKSGSVRSREIAPLVTNPSSTVAYVCGPSGWMASVTDSLLEAGLPASAIHYERFDYAAGGGHLDELRRRQALTVLAVILAAIVVFALR